MPHNRSSQSALEYMMTYGWAILIIVIVAGGLYSLGIFNPTASAGTTVTGFNGLGSVQAACYAGEGLMISLGNSAGYTILINKINYTANGATTVINASTLIPPSQTDTFFAPNACPAASGAQYSVRVSVAYTEPGQTFSGPYFSSGTVAGSTASRTNRMQLTITPSAATPAPFQQMVNLNTTKYSQYTSSLPANVYFTYTNGTVIPSWLENNGSSTKNATFWLKFAGGFSSAINVYLWFLPKGDSVINTQNIGEAPQLSSTYAEYDDGANVFTNYWNFAGTSLPSGITAVSGTAGTDYKVDNGLQLLTTNARIQSTTSLSGSYVLEMYHQFISNAYNGWVFGVYSSSSAAFGMHVDGNGGTSSWAATYYYNNAYYIIANTGETIGSGYYFIWQIINNAGSIITNFDSPSYSTYYTASFTNTVSAPITIGERFDNIGTGQSMNDITYWLRVRAYPPNGIMPAVSFGSVQ